MQAITGTGGAVGDLREIVPPRLLELGYVDAAVVGGDRRQQSAGQSLPQGLTVLLIRRAGEQTNLAASLKSGLSRTSLVVVR